MSPHRAGLQFEDQTVTVEITRDEDRILVRVGDREIPVSARPLGDGVLVVTCGSRRLIVHHAVDAGVHYLQVDGEVYTFRHGPVELESGAAPASRATAHLHDLRAPMPGIVTHVLVTEGQVVAAGDPLFVLEAMKMETVIRAVVPSVVTALRAAPGERVDGGAVVVEVEQVAGEPP